MKLIIDVSNLSSWELRYGTWRYASLGQIYLLPPPFFPAAFLPTPFPFPSLANPGMFRPKVENGAELPPALKNDWTEGVEGSGLGDDGDCRPEDTRNTRR